VQLADGLCGHYDMLGYADATAQLDWCIASASSGQK
jgi:hypothetical protein